MNPKLIIVENVENWACSICGTVREDWEKTSECCCQLLMDL
jgi:hypothetical protein